MCVYVVVFVSICSSVRVCMSEYFFGTVCVCAYVTVCACVIVWTCV